MLNNSAREEGDQVSGAHQAHLHTGPYRVTCRAKFWAGGEMGLLGAGRVGVVVFEG